MLYSPFALRKKVEALGVPGQRCVPFVLIRIRIQGNPGRIREQHVGQEGEKTPKVLVAGVVWVGHPPANPS